MLAFDSPLRAGTLIGRSKRFFAEIRFDDGEQVLAHCANTGRMTGLLEPGATVWCRPLPPGRQLRFGWELVQTTEGMACINTQRANQLLALTPAAQWMPGTQLIKREPRVGTHRFDFELSRDGAAVYVEVKSVTLCESGLGLFPDAPSARASAHLKCLTELAESGIETHLVWVAMHTGIQSVAPNANIDPAFAELCGRAEALGVGLHAWATYLSPEGISLGAALPYRLVSH